MRGRTCTRQDLGLENMTPQKRYLACMDYRDRITIEPGKRSGKPCIRGLRITVYDILDYLAGGMSEDEILVDFPSLEREDIRGPSPSPRTVNAGSSRTRPARRPRSRLKLLFDQNLAPALARRLSDVYAGSVHVQELGLAAADDQAV